MHAKPLAVFTAAALVLACAQTADAALLSRLGGQALYDTDLDITWLADANAGAGSAFDNGVSNTDGMMTWANARAWAASLAVGGVSGWRLPETILPDAGCTVDYQGTTPSTTSSGFFCTASEMGHMHYVELSGTSATDVASSGDPDLAQIVNLMSGVRQYWSGTDIPPSGISVDTAWSFDFRAGRQEPGGEPNEFFAWAVRDGDVAAAAMPASGTASLLGLSLGVLLLAGATRRARPPASVSPAA